MTLIFLIPVVFMFGGQTSKASVDSNSESDQIPNLLIRAMILQLYIVPVSRLTFTIRCIPLYMCAVDMSMCSQCPCVSLDLLSSQSSALLQHTVCLLNMLSQSDLNARMEFVMLAGPDFQHLTLQGVQACSRLGTY